VKYKKAYFAITICFVPDKGHYVQLAVPCGREQHAVLELFTCHTLVTVVILCVRLSVCLS